MPIVRRVESMKVLVLALSVCLVTGCVTKTEFQPYQNSVRDLEVKTGKMEKRLPELEREVNAAAAVRTDLADVKADMIDVRTEIQTLRGDLSSGLHDKEVEGRERESLEESVALQLSYLQQKMDITEARLARIEEYFGLKPLANAKAGQEPPKQASVSPTRADSGEKTVAPVAVAAAPPQKQLTPEEAYEMAYHLFKSEENEAARKAFDQFIRRYPESSLVDNALFWIGETYYRMGDYENAVLNYQQVIKKYPKGSKGPDALLKMGYALERMKEPEAAIAAMEKLLKAYPKAPQAKLATRKIEQLKSSQQGSEKDKGN